MKKRISAILIAAIMLLALAACAGTEIEDGEERIAPRGGDSELMLPLQNPGSGTTVLASDYDEIYALITEHNERMNQRNVYGFAEADGVMAEEGESDISRNVVDAPAATSAEPELAINDSIAPAGAVGGGGMDEGGSLEFSDTNNQVDGVQESDIVKTDGRNIYITSWVDNSVNVIAVNNGNMELVTKIQHGGENSNIREMLLYDGKLILIWNNWEQIEIEPLESEEPDWTQDVMYGYWGDWNRWRWVYETIVEVYDTNGSFDNPISSYSQTGWYNSSRMTGSNIYILSNYSPPMPGGFARTDLQYYIPSYTVNNDEPVFIPAGAIALPERIDWIEYTVIGGLDVNQSDMLVSISAHLGGTHLIYVSLNNIYLTRTDYEHGDNWSWWQNHTVIDKFSINAGNVAFAASGRVKGYVGNQFYMDEHNGIFRIVTEVWGEVEANQDNWWSGWGPHGASLYTMDAGLNILDEVHEIGFGENVQSVRFEGDIGYIVTFFIVDPLFSFDLSDPHNIVQLDELKIPGFSRYMHRWADGLLLGVGVDADEEDGMRTGLKLSMFDTSDNENLFERHVYVITRESFLNNNNQSWQSDDWSWSWISSPAEWDHKSILICPDKNIIAFPYNYNRSSMNEWHNESLYAVFSYDADNGFTLLNEILYYTGDGSDWWYGSGYQRGLYIGDYLYITAEDRIVSMNLNNVQEIQELRFFDYEAWYAEMQAQWALWEEPVLDRDYEVWDEDLQVLIPEPDNYVEIIPPIGELDDEYIAIMPLPAIEPRG